MARWMMTGRRMSPLAAVAGGVAGLLGAIVPGWITLGSLSAGVLAATFPDSIPTLPPFLGALVASTLVSLLVAWRRPGERCQPTLQGDAR